MKNERNDKSIKTKFLVGASLLTISFFVQPLNIDFAVSGSGSNFKINQAHAGGDGDGGDGGDGDGGDGDGGDGDGGGEQTCFGTQTRSTFCQAPDGTTVADSWCINDEDVPDPPFRTEVRTCTAVCQIPPVDPLAASSDPLVIDLGNDGITFVDAESDRSVMFDMNNDGVPDQSGWIGRNDGLLAIDDNGNCSIDNQSELFGTDDLSAYGELATHDSNGDGLINEHDDVWDSLKIWNDANGNGVTDAGELRHVAYFGVTEFNLNYEETDTSSAGNEVTGAGWVERIGGAISAVIETLFRFLTS